MPSLTEFIRWARQLVVDHPEVANYELTVELDGRLEIVSDFDINHGSRELIFSVSPGHDDDGGFNPEEDE